METIIQLLLDIILIVAFAGALWGYFIGTHAAVKRMAATAAVFLLVALGAALCAVIVPAGNVGVVTAFGQVRAETDGPGLHFRLPIVNVVHMVDTRVQPHQFQEIDAASKELQTVKLTGTMNYHIDGQYASDLYQRVGDDFASRIIDPAFNDFIKTVVPDYSVNDILANRDAIRNAAKKALSENLAQYHIIVDDIYIANIAFSDSFQAAIEAKQVAQQQVQQASQILAQKQIEAQQAVAVAKGQADANVTVATGQAQANKLLTQSLTPELIQYTLVTKLSDKIQVILMPAGQSLILDPKSLITSPAPQ